MTWRRETWSADHALPIGVTTRAQVGDLVRAGDIIAAGATVGSALRISGARRLGLAPRDLEQTLRVPVGSDVRARTVLARTGRRFARTVTAPIDGRLLHLTVDGDLYVAPIVDRWTVRATLDGAVSRSDDATVTIEGEAWCVQGAAAYGPDAVGELTMVADGPAADIAPSRIDVRLSGRIIFGGARVSAEAITRAHACDVAGLVAGGAAPAGLRVVYGDTVTASGLATREDRPTVLCLVGFGSAALPDALYAPLAAMSGARAAIHALSARLFVFASADVGVPDSPSPGETGEIDREAAPSRARDEERAVADLETELEAGTQGEEELIQSADISSLPER
ncbi:MAG: hypothetical protein E6J13_13285 [Chloroflexi bacterium]|nr:MAG: hypothetical protein E6J13_13285 [Chloroflexota bacterium]